MTELFPANSYLFKVRNKNIRKRCEICLKLTIKTPGRRHWRFSSVFIVNFEHILHLFLVFLLLTLTKKMFSGIVTVCLVYSNIMKTMILFYLKTSMCHNFITRFQQIIKLAISGCYQKYFPSVSKSSNTITRYLLHNMIIMLKIFEEDGLKKRINILQ